MKFLDFKDAKYKAHGGILMDVNVINMLPAQQSG
jgi:hypothetical protein